MDLGEKVSVDMIADEMHDEETCAFCSSTEPPKDVVNDLTDEHDEDAEAKLGDNLPTYKFKNDAGKLGTALGGKPDAKIVTLADKDFEASVAAHHLIPGNAALKDSKLFKSEKYLWKDGKAKGNIGYNINAGETASGLRATMVSVPGAPVGLRSSWPIRHWSPKTLLLPPWISGVRNFTMRMRTTALL